MTRRTRGFTLLELMIAVAVVAILTAIAFPSYNAYVARTRRADAKAMLLEAAAWMEQNHALHNGTYALPAAALATAHFDKSPRTGTTFYDIAFTGTPDATTFELTATVKAGVWSEPLCTSLSINEIGSRTATGTQDSTYCWAK